VFLRRCEAPICGLLFCLGRAGLLLLEVVGWRNREFATKWNVHGVEISQTQALKKMMSSWQWVAAKLHCRGYGF
jgi:hypothetical protein